MISYGCPMTGDSPMSIKQSPDWDDPRYEKRGWWRLVKLIFEWQQHCMAVHGTLNPGRFPAFSSTQNPPCSTLRSRTTQGAMPRLAKRFYWTKNWSAQDGSTWWSPGPRGMANRLIKQQKSILTPRKSIKKLDITWITGISSTPIKMAPKKKTFSNLHQG